MRWLVFLLVTAAFAGCTGAPDVGTDSGQDPDGAAVEPTLDCDDSGSCEATGDGFTGKQGYTCDDPELQCTWGTETVETPVDWSGHTKEGAYVCGGGLVPPPSGAPIGLTGCFGQQIQPDGAFQTVETYEWRLVGVDLTLEWTPADATQTGLALNIVDQTGGAQLGTWEDSSTFTVKEDLSVEYDESTLEYELLFQVWPVAKDGGGTFVDVTQQEFTLTGNILSEKPVLVSVEWVGASE